jgi:hypothetical protein
MWINRPLFFPPAQNGRNAELTTYRIPRTSTRISTHHNYVALMYWIEKHPQKCLFSVCETCLKFVSTILMKYSNILKASRPVVMCTSDTWMLFGSQTFESESKYKTLSISVRENGDHTCWHATSKPPKRSDPTRDCYKHRNPLITTQVF